MLQKLLFIFLVGLMVNVQPLKAQEDDPAEEETSAPEWNRNYENILQGGLSFGYYGYSYVGDRVGVNIPISVGYEKYLNEFFSLGGFLGYASYRYEDVNDRKYGWTFIDFGPRASFHYLPFLNEVFDQDLDLDKFDFYLTAMIIFESRNFSSDNAFYDGYYDNELNISLGTIAGFRYTFTNNLSIYFEGGRGTFGYGTLGVSFFF